MEKEKMTDTISRQAAIDEVNDADVIVFYHEDDPIDEAIEEAIFATIRSIAKSIGELPSAQPEQRWIPCSKTIEIPDHEVLCCDKYGEELIGWLSYSDDQWLCESDGEIMYDPIAWCEKPEPWRGEK